MDELPMSGEESAEVSLARQIARASPGHASEAEADLYRLLAPRARRDGRRQPRDAHAAADLMQQVLALTIEQLRNGGLREPERVVSFVLGACRLTVMDGAEAFARADARREPAAPPCRGFQ